MAAAVVPALTAGHAAGARNPVCVSSSPAHARLADRLSRGITAAYRHRSSAIGLAAASPSLGIRCSLHASRHFYSASVAKVTILAALLRKADERRRHLTWEERRDAWRMITRSDNAAASRLWRDARRGWLWHFLRLAGMTHTVPGPDGYWGLTVTTAADQERLLHLLEAKNRVLTKANRRYELYLMARVIPAQRWGTPAGVSVSYRVHVKNGWLPAPGHGWTINSLGVFTRADGRGYTIAVLTGHNRTMRYGITTVQRAARVINRTVSAAAGASAITVPPATVPAAGNQRPDEHLPPRLIRRR